MSSPSDRTRDGELPVDERLVAPGARFEIDNGKLVYVPPALEPHAKAHSALGALLVAHREASFSVAIDMLTRTSLLSDLAPDASVYPSARHPVTGGRQLEELAFELLATTTRATAASKAAQLADRGVRRIFAIDLQPQRVFEWSHELRDWSIMATDGLIEDRALAVPLATKALLGAAEADDAVVRAYRLQRHPEFLAEREEGRREGRVEGLDEGRAVGRDEGRALGREEGREEGRAEAARAVLRQLLEARFGDLDPVIVARIASASSDIIARSVVRVLHAPAPADVFDDEDP